MLRNAQKRTAVEWDYETDMSERNEEQKRKYEVRQTADLIVNSTQVHDQMNHLVLKVMYRFYLFIGCYNRKRC